MEINKYGVYRIKCSWWNDICRISECYLNFILNDDLMGSFLFNNA